MCYVQNDVYTCLFWRGRCLVVKRLFNLFVLFEQ